MKIAINGFGRIGRQTLRALIAKKSKLEVVAINDLVDTKTLAHLFEFDSAYGIFDGGVEASENALKIDGREIKVFAEKDPSQLPWKDLGVDVVIESTGFFCDKEGASKHLTAGAKCVIISAPGKGGVDATIVRGVNCDSFDPKNQKIVSNASCTTNCLAPVVKVLNDNFGVAKGLMTTTHAYTADQRLIDAPHKDLRRARAAALSIIPTSTGAAKAVGEVLPEMKGKLTGISFRIPTPTVSVVDFVAEVKKEASAKEINAALKKASENEMKGILGFEERPLVSMDYKGNPLSSIVDAENTLAIENMVKVVAWYDNEWGYSNRLVELAELAIERL